MTSTNIFHGFLPDESEDMEGKSNEFGVRGADYDQEGGDETVSVIKPFNDSQF